MDEPIKQIGERLKGLREVLNIPAEEVAKLCDITLEHYQMIEAGEADPSVYRLSKISKRYGISLDVLMFGEEPHMSTYFLTRQGQGPEVERRKDYKYESLASGFRGTKFNKNSHDGQEFDYVVEGRLEITIGNKVMILNEGDSIYFDAKQPHCMRALDGKPVKFL